MCVVDKPSKTKVVVCMLQGGTMQWGEIDSFKKHSKFYTAKDSHSSCP